jgi:hypothetical protein
MFTVKIVDDDQEPVKGARVMISFTSMLRGHSTTEYSDSEGRAEFPDYEDGEITVFVNGDNVGTYYYKDDEEITVVI